MTKIPCRTAIRLVPLSSFVLVIVATASEQSPGAQTGSQIGREVAIPTHLQDGDESNVPLAQLIDYGRQLFTAKFTMQEGAGRPMTKGTGAPISDPSSPLLFSRNFDRVLPITAEQPRRDLRTLYVDGRPAGAFETRWLGEQTDSWEMGDDGVYSFLTQTPEGIKRVRVTMPNDTSVDTVGAGPTR